MSRENHFFTFFFMSSVYPQLILFFRGNEFCIIYHNGLLSPECFQDFLRSLLIRRGQILQVSVNFLVGGRDERAKFCFKTEIK